MPFRLYADQKTLNFLYEFIPPLSEKESEDTVMFEYLEISKIDSVINYKPRGSFGQVYNDLSSGNKLSLVKVMGLKEAHILLKPVTIRQMSLQQTPIQNLFFENWRQIQNYLSATRLGQTVKIGIKLGSRVVDLILTR